MKKCKEFGPKVSLSTLGAICFVTLLMCQIRFKITKELNHETLTPPIMRRKDYWFLYSVGSGDGLQYVMRTFMIVSTPLVSLFSTILLLFGKTESNPYYFIPWLFLTLKGLLLVQTDNLFTIFKDMTNMNLEHNSRMEDVKWLLFYFTFFMIDLVEAFSFCEMFDLFLHLWNRHSKYIEESEHLEGVKKDLADIIESLSKCSSAKSSKMSLGSIAECEEGNEILTKNEFEKTLLKGDEKTFEERLLRNLLKRVEMRNELGESFLPKQLDLRMQTNTHSEGDGFVKDKEKLRNFLSSNISPESSPTAETEDKPEDADYKNYCSHLIDSGPVSKLIEEIWAGVK